MLDRVMIRTLRIANGLTQKEVAELTDIPESSYASIEIGTGKLTEERRKRIEQVYRDLGILKSKTSEPKAVEPETEDIINKPNHYHKGGIDVIGFVEKKVSKEALAGFYQINIIKYVTRYHDKGGIEDLKKAQFYLNKLIELEETS